MHSKRLRLVIGIVITVFLIVSLSSAWYRKKLVKKKSHINKDKGGYITGHTHEMSGGHK